MQLIATGDRSRCTTTATLHEQSFTFGSEHRAVTPPSFWLATTRRLLLSAGETRYQFLRDTACQPPDPTARREKTNREFQTSSTGASLQAASQVARGRQLAQRLHKGSPTRHPWGWYKLQRTEANTRRQILHRTWGRRHNEPPKTIFFAQEEQCADHLRYQHISDHCMARSALLDVPNRGHLIHGRLEELRGGNQRLMVAVADEIAGTRSANDMTTPRSSMCIFIHICTSRL